MRTIVVTGASTGIGFALVDAFLQHGYRVYGSVRRADDAERLEARFGPQFRALRFDVTDEAAVRDGAAAVADGSAGSPVFALVNNAGICVAGPLAHVPIARLREQLEVNVVGALAVTQAFLPSLVAGAKRGEPRPCIVNISSVAGRIAPPFMGPYCASKFGLEALSDSLRRELRPFGVDVVSVQPGPVVTPIWEKAEARLLSDYPDTPYQRPLERFQRLALNEARRGLPASAIAERLVAVLAAKRRPARYAQVPGRLINWTIPRRLPTALLDFLIAKTLGLG